MCCPPKTPCECCCTIIGTVILVCVGLATAIALLYIAGYILLFLAMFICYFCEKCDTCYYIYVKEGCRYLVNDCIGCCKIMCCPRNNRISDESSYEPDADSDLENQIELPVKKIKTPDIIIIQNPGPFPLSMGRECININ